MKPLKVLIVNTVDQEGGAARAAYRLHKSLLSVGLDSKMLVRRKLGDDPTVIESKGRFNKVLCILRPKLEQLFLRNYKHKTATLFSPMKLPFSSIVAEINASDADVIHLHSVHGGMFKAEDLAKIEKPTVWSMHDMLAFTGGCHYDEYCGRYKEGCGACPVLNSNSKYDLSHRAFKRKQNVYSKKDIVFVGLSRWLATTAQQSLLLKEKSVVNIPNPIDTNEYAPCDKVTAKHLLGLPQDKKIILFGAMSATSDPRKGFKQLLNALTELQSQRDIALAVFGSSKPPEGFDLDIPAYYLGRLFDDVSLRIAYCAADIMVAPSLQENLSNTIMESMACGTSVVAFDIGGNGDFIDHSTNGYLAKATDSKDLANGIKLALLPENILTWGTKAREKVEREFAQDIVADKYVSLYNSLFNRHLKKR